MNRVPSKGLSRGTRVAEEPASLPTLRPRSDRGNPSSAGGREISWFGLFQWPLLPVGGGREAAGQFMDMHGIVAKLLYVLIVLHILGALKHQFINRDNVLHRMIPMIPRRP